MLSAMKRCLKINAADNVAIAHAEDLSRGETVVVGQQEVVLQDDIACGHKFALQDMALGDNVIKYGYPIGYATEDIKEGDAVHSHNMKTKLDIFSNHSNTISK